MTLDATKGTTMAEQMMKGFPPPPEGQVTLANWRLSPFNRWAFHHVREIIPTADIPHDAAGVRELPEQPQDLSRLPIANPGGDTVPLARFLDDSSTDGIVVLHKGRLVFERYGNGMTVRAPHILMSISKSMLALVAGILADRGILDVDRPATDYVPEVRDTAFAGATVRHLLDMRTGLVFDEDYTATSGPIIEYRKATGWNPLAPGEQLSDLRTFFRQLTQADRAHGGRFHYISVNTDLLGWVVERAAGQRFADLMSELIWQPMGAADSAYLTIDRLGASRCAGGVCTTTRDLARVGQLIADGGARGTRQIIPEAWIADILDNGDTDAWNAGSFIEIYPGAVMHYRSKWYVENGPKPLMFGLGIHGQNLFIDRANDIVIAKFSSQAPPLDAGLIATTGAMVAAIRNALGSA
jgi:CubicO group peptidase (beta-lactamase class C family)